MSDVFDRLKKKARPTVPARDTSLIREHNEQLPNDQMTEFSHSSNDEILHQANNRSINENPVPKTKEQEHFPELIRRTIRLEQEIDSQLNSLCATKKITRDTFLEAAMIICAKNEKLMQEILNEAQKRYQQRKQAGEERKFQTMAKKIGFPPNQ